jgi:glycosyltransferase involved in cell wall biosynthesis
MGGPKTTPELDILILGPVPPPYGGVSVHLSRFVPLLKGAGFRVAVLNHFDSTEMSFVVGALKRNPVNYYRLPKRFSSSVVHYHHSRWSTLVALALARSNNKARYVLTLHSPHIRDQLKSRVPLVGRVTEWALRRFDAIIVVNADIEAAIRGHVDGRLVAVLPAFLEPTDDGSGYDASIEAFFESGRTLLVSAYRVQFLRDGSDLYGLDTAVEAFVSLAPDRPELRLALFIAERPGGRKGTNHLANLQSWLEQVGLSKRVLIAFGLPLVSAFRHDVVVVRPTRTEGDALSIREALRAGVPVVASDVTERPAGVVTFSGEDVDHLCTTISRVLDLSDGNARESRSDVGDEASDYAFVEGLMRIYREQMGFASSEAT